MEKAKQFMQRTMPKATTVDIQTETVNIDNPQVNSISTNPNKDDYYVEYYEENSDSPFNANTVNITRNSLQTIEPNMVRAKRQVTLPPQSRARIEVSISNPAPTPYIIEPTTEGKLRSLPGLGKQPATVLDVVNISREPLLIRRRQVLGRAIPLDSNQVEEGNKPSLPPNLDTNQQNQLEELINRNSDLFVSTNEAIGIVPFIKHHIDTGETQPIRARPYRVSVSEQKKIQDLVDEMLQADIIRPSKSPWASPVVLVKKKGTTDLRFCVDYRKLNKVTVIDPYPIPNMDTVLETLSGNHWFSKLDVKAMYWQVLMDDDSRQKTAFVVHCGQYEFNVMPFGLVSAPMTAMRVMNEITHGLESTCFVFYDDILVFTPTFEQHLEALERLFERLNDANIKLNAKKCELLLNSVTYLGHIITPSGIEPDPEKIQAIQRFESPKNITEARSFMGMCNFFRRYIKNFANIARPIHDTIKVNQTFEWTAKAEIAMQELKDKLMSPPILVHFDQTGNLTIRCDASGYGLGAVLIQESADKLRKGVIAYTSRTLVGAEKNYATTHKECLAVIHAVKHWRHYLYGKHFDVITDHHALCWLMKTKDHTGQLMRWSLLLQEFEFTIKHESGRIHQDADCLSRNPIEAPPQAEDESELPTWPIHAVGKSKSTIGLDAIQMDKPVAPTFDVVQEQQTDPYCQNIIRILTDESLRKKERKKFLNNFVVYEDQLYKKSKKDKDKLLLVLPASMIEFVLKEAHDEPIGGHFGIKRTMDTITRRFYWPTLDKDVKHHVKTCDLCQRKKSLNRKSEGLMIPMPIPHQVFETIGMDLMGPMPISSNKYSHIIVITDYLSKYVIAKPLRKTTTDKIIEIVRKHVFYVHGIPKTIITDNGSNLTSRTIREVYDKFKITHKTTSPYRPQTNGQTERYNRVLGTQLAIFANQNTRKWDQYIDALVFAYNTTVHTSHLNTPYHLVFGREPIKPIDQYVKKRLVTSDSNNDVSEEDLLKAARDLARTLVKQAQSTSKERYDKNRAQPSYEIGDLVLKKKYTQIFGECKKFTLPWVGPYKIIKIINDVNYLIASVEDPKMQHIVHANQIKPYNLRQVEPLKEESANATPEFIQIDRIAHDL